jgi:protease-4
MILFNFLKNIFLILLFVCFVPIMIKEIKIQYSSFCEPCTPIGIIMINGVIQDSSHYTDQLHSFFKNPSIKGIIVKINSIDSFAASSQTIFHEIQQLKQQHPKAIIALVENACLSGSYLIASACDYIIAPQSALIGGIGLNVSNLQLKNIKTAQEPLLSAIQNDIYQQFIHQIAAARKLSLATVHLWAEGMIYTGNKAVSLGLINKIGSTHTAIEILKEKALIDGEIEWILYSSVLSKCGHPTVTQCKLGC